MKNIKKIEIDVEELENEDDYNKLKRYHTKKFNKKRWKRMKPQKMFF